jgi:hypothetical protein
MMNLRMKSTAYHPKQEWLSKKEEQDAKNEGWFELNQELSSGDEEAMEANAVMSGRRVA